MIPFTLIDPSCQDLFIYVRTCVCVYMYAGTPIKATECQWPSVTPHLCFLRHYISLNWELVFSQLGWKPESPNLELGLWVCETPNCVTAET